MRLMARDLSTVTLKRREVTKDNKGNQKIDFIEPVEIKMVIQPATSSVLAQIYGEKLNTVKSCKYQGIAIQEGQNELDGVCVYVGATEKPDYKIASIQTFTDHVNVTLERL